ncbi:hypothetical protein CJP72_09150 [Citrobacter sp. NCU1]|uniref:hypothetical protein n=1 Tax=Citrobacter sp. NCU1 TaxID=2026683 RepID=UPI0013919284|nr:hypothetical protein [Citrobacter sp. NCU1]NDO80927.1 hypothetical protein [Citrobacter sp. NCU1]
MLTNKQKEDLFLWVAENGKHQVDLDASILELETESSHFDAYDFHSVYFRDGYPFAARDEMTFDAWVIKRQKL